MIVYKKIFADGCLKTHKSLYLVVKKFKSDIWRDYTTEKVMTDNK